MKRITDLRHDVKNVQDNVLGAAVVGLDNPMGDRAVRRSLERDDPGEGLVNQYDRLLSPTN